MRKRENEIIAANMLFTNKSTGKHPVLQPETRARNIGMVIVVMFAAAIMTPIFLACYFLAN